MTQPLEPSATPQSSPTGFVTLTLHAHLPYVVRHGTWPHGMEWLHEATAETYLPLLRVFDRLERDGMALRCNLVLSPILLEQLAHPIFLAEFPKYLDRKIVAAREDEAFFVQSGEVHYAETARFWHRFFTEAAAQFQSLRGGIVAAFRHFNDSGAIDILTCAATHGYLPLLGTDESVRAQVRLAVETHTRHLGKPPRGIWSPECGYRPAGNWAYPIPQQDSHGTVGSFERVGVEQVFAESGLAFFFVDTHLVEESSSSMSPYGSPGLQTFLSGSTASNAALAKSPYRPYLVEGDYDHHALTPVAAFPRDPRTGLQVWSGEHGYPGDAQYLDFHKKRWPGGHRYWRVTGGQVGMNDKQPYYPERAAATAREHAAHFIHLVVQTLEDAKEGDQPPVLSAPFDAELFGHWWFEGPQWLEAVARGLHRHASGVVLTAVGDYLKRYPASTTLAMPEGSWGAGGENQVWLNDQTSWTWAHLYPAERTVREICTGGRWGSSPLGKEIVQQLCRELLLLESSDWQFLITTGAARDYAELRFHTHLDQFNDLQGIWRTCDSGGDLSPEQTGRLREIQERDTIFPDLDPGFWAEGAREAAGAIPSSP